MALQREEFDKLRPQLHQYNLSIVQVGNAKLNYKFRFGNPTHITIFFELIEARITIITPKTINKIYF